jgi:methylated-DNA-[protein]-cysteine S-methyltransferase
MRRHLVTEPTEIGPLTLVADGDALAGLYMEMHRHQPDISTFGPAVDGNDRFLKGVVEQLSAYFAGEIQTFDLAVAPKGTPFQQRVWAALQEIPYGETWSYRQLADHIGQPTASRAVGLANGKNPVSIIIPCHRVIGASGSLTGYGGGIERKQLLLDLERTHSGDRLF